MSIILYFSELSDARVVKPDSDLASVLASAEVAGEKTEPDELVLYCGDLTRRLPVPGSACSTPNCCGRPTPWKSTARRSGSARSW
jgi:hypothetical protein